MNNSFMITAVLGCWVLLSTCDTRKPSEFEKAPILEVAAKDTLFTYFDAATPVNVVAVLKNADGGTLSQQANVHFTMKHGTLISGVVPVSDGIAVASYYPSQRTTAYIDTIGAYFAYNNLRDTIKAFCTIRVLPKTTTSTGEVGSVSLSTANPAVEVHASGGNEQTVVTARVLDAGGNPVNDGSKVTFRIISGPGGGENLNSVGRFEDTASTRGGAAYVTFNSGSKVGVVEIQASCGGKSVQARLLSITSGPPARIDIDADENSVKKEGGRWRMYVSAILTDLYYNPVKESTSVIFTFDTAYTFMRGGEQVKPAYDKMTIQNAAVTEVRICPTCDSIPGTAVTWMTYSTSVIYDSVRIIAETQVNGVRVAGASVLTLPIPPSDIHVFVTVRDAPVRVPNYGSDTVTIDARLSDGYNPIVGGTLCIATDMGTILNTAKTSGGCGVTDSSGNVRFLIRFTIDDQIDQTQPTQTNNVTVTEPTRQFTGKNSFTVVFP